MITVQELFKEGLEETISALACGKTNYATINVSSILDRDYEDLDSIAILFVSGKWPKVKSILDNAEKAMENE